MGAGPDKFRRVFFPDQNGSILASEASNMCCLDSSPMPRALHARGSARPVPAIPLWPCRRRQDGALLPRARPHVGHCAGRIIVASLIRTKLLVPISLPLRSVHGNRGSLSPVRIRRNVVSCSIAASARRPVRRGSPLINSSRFARPNASAAWNAWLSALWKTLST